MKIEWGRVENGVNRVILEAEDEKEAIWLKKFFEEDCKRISKKFPLKDEMYLKDWKKE